MMSNINQTGYCFGIDLGTSNSSICFVNPKGRHPLPYVHVEAVKIPTANSNDYSSRLPSILLAAGNAVKAGFEALTGWKAGRLWNTLFASAKSELGAQRFYDDAVDEKLETPVKVQAEILRQLVSSAKERTGEDPCKGKVVITVPASFNMGQRKDTLEAAKLAGLSVGDVDLLDEPNAAFLDLVNSQAIDRLDLSTPKTLLVFDFGGGTCDISILRVQRDDEHPPMALRIENLAISNYARLGGDNLDLLLVQKVLLPAVCRESGIEFERLSEKDKRELRWALKEVARRLKESLCDKARTAQRAREVANPTQAWTADSFDLSDAGVSTKQTGGEMGFSELEALLSPFFGAPTNNDLKLADGYYMASILTPVREALGKAKLSPEEVDAVVFNGGSCRNPLVGRAFAESGAFRNAEILDQGDLDLAVARGAAVRCFYRADKGFDPITPIVSAELGLITHGEKYQTLVDAGTVLPFPPNGDFQKYTDCFWLPKDHMNQVYFPIYCGKEGNRCLVQTMSLGVPRDAGKGDAIVIELQIDSNKVMRFRAFLADQPSSALDVTLENPLATQLPSPEQTAALEMRTRLSKKRQASKDLCHSPDELVELALLEYSAGEFEQALDLVQRLQSRMAKQQQTLPAKAHNAMGRCYERLGRYDLAVDQFKKASQMDIGVGVYAANTGLGLVRMGKAEDAIPCLKWAITCDSEDGYPHAVLGDALRLLGREAEAGVEYLEGKKRLETTLRSCPNNKFALNWLADVCLRLGLYEEASTYKRRASEIVRKGHWGAPADDFVAGMASGMDGLVSLRDSSS